MNCFVAEVIELPGCMADGENVAEAMEKLDVIVEEWLETAHKLGREIPKPLYYEKETECMPVIEDEKEPYYDVESKTWKVVTEHGREEGDAMYIACEFVRSGVYYPFHIEPLREEKHHDHEHDFSAVISFLLEKPDYFSVVGFEEYYSQQELDLISKIKDKLHISGE